MTCDFCGKDNRAVVMQGDRTFVCGSAECLQKAQMLPFSGFIASLIHSERRTREQGSGTELYPKLPRTRPDAVGQDRTGSEVGSARPSPEQQGGGGRGEQALAGDEREEEVGPHSFDWHNHFPPC